MCREKITLIILLLLIYSSSGEQRDIVLKQGVVRGYDVDTRDVISFYGIPYATVPKGEDRFKAPLPPRSWDGVLNATSNNIVCYQGKEFDPAILDAVKTYDCLIVNIFIPKDTNETKLPVLFLIHGGAMQFGNGNQWYPGGLVAKGMIVVTFNFRLGVHGFLCLNTEYAPGNAGMKDKIAALRWLKGNIARFGGDPDNISMSGTSSGSAAAEFIVLSPMSDGLIKRAMYECGSAFTPSLMVSDPIMIAENFANQLGVYTNRNVTLLESFYRSLKDEQLNIMYNSNFKHLGFVPCVETHNLEGVEKFLKEAPFDILNNGNYRKIPLMPGFTTLDGMDYFLRFFNYDEIKTRVNLTDFIPENIKIRSKEHALELTESIKKVYFPTGEITAVGFVNFFTDTIFAYPLYMSSRINARNGVSVHLYYFKYNGTINLPIMRSKSTPIWGPGHVAQSLYLYDYDERSIYHNITEEERELRDKLRDIYYSYCKDGDPAPKGLNIDWPPVSVDAVNILYVDKKIQKGELPLQDRLKFWDKNYQYDYINAPGAASANSSPLFISVVIFIAILLF